MCPEPNTGCWLWIGPVDHGRRRIRYAPGRHLSPKLASWRIHRGEQKHAVYQTCGQTECFNPDHLSEHFCLKCKKAKTAEDFSSRPCNGLRRASYCRTCERHRSLLKMREKRAKQGRPKTHRSGVEYVRIEKILAEQNGMCAICDVYITQEYCVDHCHSTSVIRGLLCAKCNLALGLFSDDPGIVKRAVDYLSHQGDVSSRSSSSASLLWISSSLS